MSLDPQIDLVAHYDFEDTSGVDSAGNYPATFYGNWTSETGINDGLAQKGVDTNSFIRINGLGTWFQGRTDFTMSAWHNIPFMSSVSAMLFAVSHTSHSTPHYRFTCRIFSNRINLQLNANANVWEYYWPSTPVGRFHVCITVTGTTMSLYINKDLVAAFTTDGLPIGSCYPDAMMGRIPALSSTANAAIIDIDEFRLYSRALSAAEIEELYYIDSTGSAVVITSQVAGVVSVSGVPSRKKITVMSMLAVDTGLKNQLDEIIYGRKVLAEGMSDALTGAYTVDVSPFTGDVLIMVDDDWGEVWLANRIYIIGDVIHPTKGNEIGYVYECVGGGSAGDQEPIWWADDGSSSTGAVGTASFKARQFYQPITHGPVSPLVT